MEGERYTGIIRTMPIDHTMLGDKHTPRVIYRKIVTHFRHMELCPDTTWWYTALPGKPRYEVLHLYLLFAGQIRWRLHIAEYTGPQAMERMDGKMMFAKAWAICTAPVEKAPFRIERKGFQGFRYVTEPLW